MHLSTMFARLLICPVVVWLSELSFEGVHYGTPWGWIVTGGLLAVLGEVMDRGFLDRLGHVGSFFLDLGAATLVVWVSQFLFAGAAISWIGALSAGFFLASAEIAVHAAIQYRRRQKARQE